MGRIAVVTDSNSGITQNEAKEYGVDVISMPFFINGETYFEDIDLTQEAFYEKLEEGADISTSMPAVGAVTDLWDNLLKNHQEILYIPMSSGLSSSCETAMMLAQEYGGKVQVVNNQRISVTQKQTVLDSLLMVERGMGAREIKEYLEATKHESSIYIMVDTLYYLKKGGRITAAAAALGTLLKLKPVLQIQGDKLDAFAKARTVKQAKSIMMTAIAKDFAKRFQDETGDNMWIYVAYTKDPEMALELKSQLQELYPKQEIAVAPLSLSIACHIGPGALAIACSKRLS
ncbi:MAG: DegV family protein [Lachnospiraceae bacterium]